MKRLTLFLLAAGMITSCSKDPNEEFLASNPDFVAKFDSTITSLYQDYHLYGDFIIGLVNKDGLFYSYAMNKDILEGRPSSLNNDSPIYLASHTKSFTGTLLKILEEEGMVDLDKSLHDYLPEPKFDGSIDILNHVGELAHRPENRCLHALTASGSLSGQRTPPGASINAAQRLQWVQPLT